MPFFKDLVAKIKTLGSAVADFFRELSEKVAQAGILGRLCGFACGAIQNTLRNLLEKIPAERRRLFFLGMGSAFAVLLLACVGVALLIQKDKTAVSPSGGSASARRVLIPPEELFLPEEPDFIPGVLLERERRSSWTVEDAAIYWQDPMKHGEAQWRDRVETAVDELLERIP
jgi:hypothetical protein